MQLFRWFPVSGALLFWYILAAMRVGPSAFNRPRSKEYYYNIEEQARETGCIYLVGPDDEDYGLRMGTIMWIAANACDWNVPPSDLKLIISATSSHLEGSLRVYEAFEGASFWSDIRTCCMSMVDGPAIILLAAGTPGKRFATSDALFRLRVDSEDKRAHIAEILAKHTGQEAADVVRDLSGEGTTLTASEALDYGIIDDIVTLAELTQ
jgi:ATP-dependent protease ClpP protease subunit